MNRDVVHSCGHTEQHMIYAQFAAESDRKARELARRSCTPCYKSRNDAAALADEALLEGQELPPLSGSEKQVSWATKIRIERLAKLHKTDPAALAKFTTIQDAKWWIDNRTADLRTLTL